MTRNPNAPILLTIWESRLEIAVPSKELFKLRMVTPSEPNKPACLLQ